MIYLALFLFAASAQGLFFAITQLSLKTKPPMPRLFLAVLILSFSLVITENALWMSNAISRFVHLISINEPLPFLFGPLIYFYFKSSIGNYKFRAKDLLHFLPFTFHFVYCAQFYFNSQASKIAMLNGEVAYGSFFAIHISSLYFIILATVSNIIYCVITWIQFYPKAEILSGVKTWFLASNGIFSLYALNTVIFYFLSFNHVVDGCANYGIPITMALFIYLFSWFGYARPKVFNGFSFKESVITIGHKGDIKTEDAAKTELWLRLEDLMDKERLYKSEDLNLDFLAKRLNASRHQLSGTINMNGLNFFEYINHWRIKEAKRLLSETTKKELNIIEVAYEVGFNNKVSFNKFFKKSTGLTPTEFRKMADTKTG